MFDYDLTIELPTETQESLFCGINDNSEAIPTTDGERYFQRDFFKELKGKSWKRNDRFGYFTASISR